MQSTIKIKHIWVECVCERACVSSYDCLYHIQSHVHYNHLVWTVHLFIAKHEEFWCVSSCPRLVWQSSEIQLLLELQEREDQDLASWSSRGSTFIHLPWSHVPLSSPFSLSPSFMTHFFILFIGFSTIFSLYLFFKSMFHHFHSLLFNLSQKHKYIHARARTHTFPCKLCV